MSASHTVLTVYVTEQLCPKAIEKFKIVLLMSKIPQIENWSRFFFFLERSQYINSISDNTRRESVSKKGEKLILSFYSEISTHHSYPGRCSLQTCKNVDVIARL